MPRDQLPRLPGDEPVRLRVVRLPARHRAGDRGQLVRIHLVVGRHHTGDVEPLVDCALVAGDDRRADTGVSLADDDLEARVGRRRRSRTLGGGVARGVVDDEDAVDELGDAGERLRQQGLLVVGRDDHPDTLALEHQCPLR